MEKIEQKVLANADYLMECIKSHPSLQLLTNEARTLQSGIVLFKHGQMTNKALYAHLQENHVVCAMRGKGVRFSAHFYNSTDELDKAIALIPDKKIQ